MDEALIAIISVVIGAITGAIITPLMEWVRIKFNEPKIQTLIEYRKRDEDVIDMRPQHFVLIISNNGRTSTHNLEMTLSTNKDLMTDHICIGTIHPQYPYEMTIGNLSERNENTICFSLSPPDSFGMRIANITSEMPIILTISFFDNDHAAWSFYYKITSTEDIKILGVTRKLRPIKKNLN